MDLELTKNRGFIGKGKSVALTDNSLTDVLTVPYNSVMEVQRIEINNKHTADTQFDIYNAFTDTDGTARTVLIGSVKVVAGLTVAWDVEGSKKAFGTVQAQMDVASPTTDPVVYVGGIFL